MCIRKDRTGLDYLTEDDGSDGYVCPSCAFQEDCHKQTKEEGEKRNRKGCESLARWC
jgi:hypothetical protein